MMIAALLGVAVACVVGGSLVGYYALWALRTRRETGHAGLTQHSRLTCPKCGGTFDYEWVPGAALTAVRLGSERYMACPLCGGWSRFDLRSAPRSPARPG